MIVKPLLDMVDTKHYLSMCDIYVSMYVSKMRLKIRDVSTIHKEYRFSLIPIFPYKGRIFGSVLIRENTGLRKPVFWHILHIVLFWKGVEKKRLSFTLEKYKTILVEQRSE